MIIIKYLIINFKNFTILLYIGCTLGFSRKKLISGKFQGGHNKIDRKSRGVNLKKIDILNKGGGVYFFYGKAHCIQELRQ